MKKLHYKFILVLLVLLTVSACKFKSKDSGQEAELFDPLNDLPIIDVSYNEIDPEGDLDGDGLTNQEEEKLGTSIYMIDSDSDGLSDYDEVNVYGTNPLESDTDGDRLKDGDEIAAGLNPLEKKTDGKTIDSLVEVEKVFACNDSTLTITGNAGVCKTYFNEFTSSGLSKTPGIVGPVYELYLDGKFESATLELTYTDEQLELSGLDEENLSILQFTDDGKFIEVKSKLDAENNTITAELEHFSKYTIGDKEIVKGLVQTQVMLLIDNSGSMYPEEMCEGSDENDVDFKRLDMAKNLVRKAGGDIQFGVAKFTATYTQLADIGTDINDITERIEGIRTAEETFDGTYIANSIKSALNNFEIGDNRHRNFIVLLTDGQTTEGGWGDWTGYDENDAIKDANKKNVTIIIVGLGNSVDTGYLNKIANGTNGMYIHVSNANALEDVYKAIIKSINYNLVDIDEDGENDGVVLVDTGFDVKKNGFSFENYRMDNGTGQGLNGQCFGMASFVQLYYLGKLPVSMPDAKVKGGSLLHRVDYTALGYDLSVIDFFASDSEFVNNKKNLYDYSNEIIDMYEGIYSVAKKDRFVLEGDKLVIPDSVWDSYITSSFIGKMEVKSKGTWEEKTYKYFEAPYYNLNNTGTDEASKEAEEFFKCLFRLYSMQFESSGILRTYKFPSIDEPDKSFAQLKNDLSAGIPVLVSYDVTGGRHTVNAVRLIRDIDNPSEMKLEIYNNNDEGEVTYFTIKQVSLYQGPLDYINYTAWTNKWGYEVLDDNQNPVTLEIQVYNDIIAN